MPTKFYSLPLALAAVLTPSLAEAACRTGPPPGQYSANDEGMTLDISPITKNPVFGAIGNAFAEATQGVSNIRTIVNMTSCPITIRKVDGWNREQKDVGPNDTLADTNFWVPWADDANTYFDHHMVISVDGRDTFWLWQDRHVIRFRTAGGYVANGQKAPGVAQGGGDRTLVVAMGSDNKPVFAIAHR